MGLVQARGFSRAAGELARQSTGDLDAGGELSHISGRFPHLLMAQALTFDVIT